MYIDYHSQWMSAIDVKFARRKRMAANPTINPETGERLRPLTQAEAYDGLVSNSWATRW